MKENVPEVEKLFGLVEDYSKTSIELFKLQAINKYAEVFSMVTSKIIIVLIASFFAICLNMALALWIGEMLGKIYYGFFIVSAFYLIIALIVWIFKKLWIEEPLQNSIIDNLMDTTN